MVTKEAIYHTDRQIMSGVPVFVGTRVPIKNLFDYLTAGDSLNEFLEDFPSVTREQAVALMDLAQTTMTEHAPTH